MSGWETVWRGRRPNTPYRWPGGDWEAVEFPPLKPAKNTRARAPAQAVDVRPVSLVVADEPGRRTPLAIVTVQIGPVRVAFDYRFTRRQGWEIRMPGAHFGTSVVSLPKDVAERVVSAIRQEVESRPDVLWRLEQKRARWRDSLGDYTAQPAEAINRALEA